MSEISKNVISETSAPSLGIVVHVGFDLQSLDREILAEASLVQIHSWIGIDSGYSALDSQPSGNSSKPSRSRIDPKVANLCFPRFALQIRLRTMPSSGAYVYKNTILQQILTVFRSKKLIFSCFLALWGGGVNKFRNHFACVLIHFSTQNTLKPILKFSKLWFCKRVLRAAGGVSPQSVAGIGTVLPGIGVENTILLICYEI